MRGTTSSHTVEQKTRRATKPVHIPAAIGTYRAPNGPRENVPRAPELSPRVSILPHRHLPTKRHNSRTSTRSRMGPLATEPSKPRPTKHTHRHNPPWSVHQLHRPTANHPQVKPGIGLQRPHLNRERHTKTCVYQPNPQTQNPASQIHSITTGTCTEARWPLEDNPPPIITMWALSQRLYTPGLGDTHIHAIRQRCSRGTGLRTRCSFNQTRPGRCISPHSGTLRQLVATRIQLDGNMVL